jgi:antitoxin MazE
MRVAVRRLGNSSGVIIPKSLLEETGIAVGDAVDMTCEQGHIVLKPAPRAARAGWAEASKSIAETGEDALVWPEFGNADDQDLVW